MVRYKLNKDAIMKAVNCSTRTFREVTQKTREALIEARDFAIEELAEKGVSQREVASRVGISAMGVNKVLSGVNKRHDAKSVQPETQQPEVSPEETTEDTQEPSVFTHITSATVPILVIQ
jgi:hypothetical protein